MARPTRQRLRLRSLREPQRRSRDSWYVRTYFAIERNTMSRMGAKHCAGPSADAVFKALGSPARLTIVRTLIEGESCVCGLVEAVGLGWSTTSRHLEVLREAGVVASQKRAQKIYYRLALGCVADFILCLDGTCHGTADSAPPAVART